MIRQTGSRSLSEAKGFGHIEAYIQSGLRPSEYYRRHNFTEYQFHKWLGRYNKSAHPELFATKSKSSTVEKLFHPVRFGKESATSSPAKDWCTAISQKRAESGRPLLCGALRFLLLCTVPPAPAFRVVEQLDLLRGKLHPLGGIFQRLLKLSPGMRPTA
jgi:hypothetical protein